jgi:hypothetical protein
VWAPCRGARPELLAVPGSPAYPPLLPSCTSALADIQLSSSRSRVENSAPTWSKPIRDRLNEGAGPGCRRLSWELCWAVLRLLDGLGVP